MQRSDSRGSSESEEVDPGLKLYLSRVDFLLNCLVGHHLAEADWEVTKPKKRSRSKRKKGQC